MSEKSCKECGIPHHPVFQHEPQSNEPLKFDHTIVLSLPEGIDQLAEETWNGNGVDFDCVGTGMGSSEYCFVHKEQAQLALKLIKAELRSVATGLCLDRAE